jgi:hypothetical protein
MTLTASKLLHLLDDGSGPTATDTSGNGNDATLQGATWETTNQKRGPACLSFDGLNDYADGVSSFGDINFKTQAFTVAWQQHCISPVASFHPIITFGVATGTNFLLNIIYSQASSRIEAIFHRADNNIAGRVDVFASGQSLNNAFHSGVITYDGSGTPDLTTLKIYIDAINVADTVSAGNFGAFQANEYRIGKASGEFYFKGLLDDLYIDDTVWTQAQVDEYHARLALARGRLINTAHISGPLNRSMLINNGGV